MSRSQESSGARLVRNALANAAGRGVNAVVALALTPFLLHGLGQTEYGIWLLATTLTFSSGYLGLAELGLQQAAVRMVAEARSRGDSERIGAVVSATTVAYGLLGIVLAAALAGLAWPLTHLFHIGHAAQHTAALVFLLVGLQIAVDLPTAGVLALIEGSQRYGLLRALEVGSRVVWATGTVVAVEQGHGVLALGVVSVATAAAGLLVAFAAARVLEPDIRLRIGDVRLGTLKELGRSGTPMLGLRVLGVVYNQMDRAIIGIVLTAAAVARYDVAYKIHATALLTIGVTSTAFMPAAAYLGASSDRDRLRRLYLNGTKFAIAFAVPVAVAGMLYAKPLIATWVGRSYVDLSGSARLFLVYPILAVAMGIGQTMLVGLNRMREVLRLNLLALIMNLVLSVALARRLGIVGVIWGTLAGYLILCVPLTVLFLREFGVRAADWARETLLPCFVPVALQLVFGFATLRWASRAGQLWEVGAFFLVDYAVAVAVFLFGVLGRDERARLIMAVRRPAQPSPA